MDQSDVHGHFWFMDSSKTELGPRGGIYAPKIGLFFLWVKRYEKKALEGGYTLQRSTTAESEGNSFAGYFER